MQFECVLPCEELTPYVRSFWCARGTAEPSAGSEAIAPDGCRELVFNFGDRVAASLPDGSKVVQPLRLLAGEIRRPTLVTPLGAVDFLGAKLTPAGVRAFVDYPAYELVDTTIALDDIAPAGFLRATDALADLPPSDRMAQLQALLLEHVEHQRHDALVSWAVTRLEAATPEGLTMTIEGLAREVSLTRRQLERRFLDAVGIAPKAFAGVLRFQRVLCAVTAQSPAWVDVATACGYFDQSHLIRDFKRFTGTTPRAFLGRHHPFSDLFLPMSHSSNRAG